MNKNSYVTAALFVVFVLLTVFYFSIGDSEQSASQVGSTSMAPQANLTINPTDAQNADELTVSEGEETTGDDTTSETMSIQALRTSLEKEKSQRVAELTAIIASKDYDAEEKSQAKDELEKINKDSQHQSTLETMIKAKGYSDVVVRVNEEVVQVSVQLEESQEYPSVEALNELYMMAKTEFANDPDVSIQFTPVN